MTIQWALVANSSFAQIVEIKGRGREIRTIWELDDPDSKKKASEIYSDRDGRSNSSVGSVKYALTNEVDYKTQLLKVFAHKIAGHLDKAIREGSFDELAIIAAPALLGELRLAFSDKVKSAIKTELSRDLTQALTQQELYDYLKEHLGLWNFGE